MSVQVAGECRNRDEEVLLDDSYKASVVVLFVPELAGPHPDPLALVLADEHLHHVFVAWVLVWERLDGLLGFVSQVLGKGCQVTISRVCVDWSLC